MDCIPLILCLSILSVYYLYIYFPPQANYRARVCGEADPEPHLPREGEQHAAARHAHRHQVSCHWSVVTPCSPLIGQAASEEAAVPVAAVPRVPAADQADLHDRGHGDERAAGAVSAALHARLLQPREEDRD